MSTGIRKSKGKNYGRPKDEVALSNKQLARELEALLFVGLCILLFYPPYLKGLFFESDLLTTIMYTFLLFAIFLFYKILIRDYALFKHPLDYAALGMVVVFLFPILFGQAASLRDAAGEVLKYFNFFAVYIMARDIVKEEKKARMLLNVVMASAIGVALLGLDAAAGEHVQVFLGNAIGYRFSEGYVYEKICSSLQYPNALASYLMAVFFIALGMQIESRKVWQKMMYGAAGFILFLTFILTYSRGAMLLFPLIFVVFLVVVRDVYKIVESALGWGAAFLVSLVTAYMTSGYMGGKNPPGIWLGVFAGSLLTSLLVFLLELMMRRLRRVERRRVMVGGLAALISAALLAILLGCVVLTTEEPVKLKHDLEESRSRKLLTRYIPGIKPDMDYKFYADLQSTTADSKKCACRVIIFSIDDGGSSEQLAYREYFNHNGYMEMSFRTEKNTRALKIDIANEFPGTSLEMKNAGLKDADGRERRIILKHKFIPYRIVRDFGEILVGEKNTAERMVYYMDALKIARDYPLFGAGGRAWENIHYKYQSYWYLSRQVHSYFAQVLVEAGTVGLIALIVFLAVMFFTYRSVIKKPESSMVSKICGITAISIVIHGVFDFDFSMAAIAMLVWVFAGLLCSMCLADKENKELAKTGAGRFAVVSILVLSIGALIYSGLLNSAIMHTKKGDEQISMSNIRKAAEHYEKAVAADPINPAYRLMLGQLYNVLSREISQEDGSQLIRDAELFNKADRMVSSAIEIEPGNWETALVAGGVYVSRGEFDRGLELVDRLAELHPLDSLSYENKALAYHQVSRVYYSANEKEKSKECLKKVLDIPQSLQHMNLKLKKPVMPTGETFDVILKSAYLYDNFDNAEAMDELEKVIYYSMMSMDCDNNSISDGWVRGDRALRTNIIDGALRIDGFEGNGNFIETEVAGLEQGEEYSITITAKGTPGHDIIMAATERQSGKYLWACGFGLQETYADYTFDFSIGEYDRESWDPAIRIHAIKQEGCFMDIKRIVMKKKT